MVNSSSPPLDRLFHALADARGLDMLNTVYHYLDLAPKGRDESESRISVTRITADRIMAAIMAIKEVTIAPIGIIGMTATTAMGTMGEVITDGAITVIGPINPAGGSGSLGLCALDERFSSRAFCLSRATDE